LQLELASTDSFKIETRAYFCKLCCNIKAFEAIYKTLTEAWGSESFLISGKTWTNNWNGKRGWWRNFIL